MTPRSCSTCKHLRKPLGRLVRGEIVQPDEFEFRCGVLFVVTQRRPYTPLATGDIVTWNQVQRYGLVTEPLTIIDPDCTETNSRGETIRAGREPMHCRAWNVDESTMPDRWEPAVEYDIAWDSAKGRYVRRGDFIVTTEPGGYRWRGKERAA